MRTVLLWFAITFSTFGALSVPAQRTDDGEPKIPPAPVPKLRASGRNVQDFVPRDWTICDQATGDLNADGRADLVFLLQGKSKALLLPNDISPDAPIDSNPYVLGVALGNPDGSFTLAMQNSTLIPRWTESLVSEYAQAVKVKQGALSVWLYQFTRSGNLYQTFLFRKQHDRFVLIGHEREELDRVQQITDTWSLNYLTHSETITHGEERSGADRVRHKQLPQKPLLTIEEVGNADDFIGFLE